MIKFIKKLLLFSIIMVVVDFCVGQIFSLLTKTAKSGDTARNEYIANRVNADVLIFGSSRAIHHYDPQIIEDSLRMSCYNCGQDGMGIILFYARYKMIVERYNPKVIIYDPLYDFDLKPDDKYSYISWLKPYYDIKGVKDIIDKVDEKEKYKMLSYQYRFNGKPLQIISDNVMSIYEETKGYRPLEGAIGYIPKNEDERKDAQLDSMKYECFKNMIEDCDHRGIKLIFIESPFYRGHDNVEITYAPLRALCFQYGVPYLSYYYDCYFCSNPNFFHDSFHLNHVGAECFTSKMISQLKRLYYE